MVLEQTATSCQLNVSTPSAVINLAEEHTVLDVFWVVLDVVAERLVESLSLCRVEYTGAEDCAEFLVDL